LGGETTVTVRGDGRGGRNTELALAAAISLDGKLGVALMTLATDGVDGASEDAGAIITGGTLARARALGLSAEDALGRNDSATFFEALGDAIKTGPTGTNVNDLVIVLAYV
jgi:hydroxypyruvate reductase